MTDPIYTEPVTLKNVGQGTDTTQDSTEVDFLGWFVSLNQDRLTIAVSKKNGSTLLSLPGKYY